MIVPVLKTITQVTIRTL